jgi:hypothetical protein
MDGFASILGESMSQTEAGSGFDQNQGLPMGSDRAWEQAGAHAYRISRESSMAFEAPQYAKNASNA